MTRWRRACASGATGVVCALARFVRGTGAGSDGLFPLEGFEAVRAVAFSVVVVGTLVVRRRRGSADVLGVCALGWGFGEYEAASALLNGPRTAGRPYRARRSMFLMVDRVCCGGYAASASRFGGAALLAGSLYLYDVVDEAVLDRVLGWWSLLA